MKANEGRLLGFLKKSPQFTIPIYQRTYSWSEKECMQLWDDIMAVGHHPGVYAHFIGSVVYIEDGFSTVFNQSPLLVIDGQQRLTTITLLLTALKRELDTRNADDREPVEGFSALKILRYYLINPEEEGVKHHKLTLTQTDRATLFSIVDGTELPIELSVRIEENFKLFVSLVEGLAGNVTGLCEGLAKLMIVEIALNRDYDNPQLIFESMNSTGKELSQADLIRNFVLMALEPAMQTQLYEHYW